MAGGRVLNASYLLGNAVDGWWTWSKCTLSVVERRRWLVGVV